MLHAIPEGGKTEKKNKIKRKEKGPIFPPCIFLTSTELAQDFSKRKRDEVEKEREQRNTAICPKDDPLYEASEIVLKAPPSKL
jgi:hypothetical protein